MTPLPEKAQPGCQKISKKKWFSAIKGPKRALPPSRTFLILFV